MTIELGDRCRDTISDFTGTAVAFTTWINGCTRFALQPKIDKDGKLPEAQWFDEPQIVVMEETVAPTGPRDTGGPLPSKPTRNADPRR